MTIKKGAYGYVKKQKNKYLIGNIIGYGTSVSIFLAGLIKYQTKANNFTIIAILILLPVTIWTIRLIMFSKYKPISEKIYDQVESIVNMGLVFDLILTNSSGIEHLPIVCLIENELFLYMPDSSTHKRIKTYLENILSPKGLQVSISIYQDVNQYVQKLNAYQKNILPCNKEVMNYLLLHSI